MEHSSFHDHMHEALGFTGLLDSSSICQCVHEMEKIVQLELDFGGWLCYMPILEFCHSICIAMSGDATGEVKRDPATVHKAVNVERDLACVCFVDFRANQGRWKGSLFPKVLV